MRESSTFLATLAEGARRMLLRQGRVRFGPPPRRIVALLKSIHHPEPLEKLCLRLLDVSSWDELMPKSAERAGKALRAGLPPTFEQVRRELLRYAAKTKIKLKVSWLYDLFPKRPVVWSPL